MECVICHRQLELTGPDRDARVALIEDGATFCRRCAVDVLRPSASEPLERVEPERELPQAA